MPPMMSSRRHRTATVSSTLAASSKCGVTGFDWVYENYDFAAFPPTIHPAISGEPHMLKMHEASTAT